MHAIKTMWLIGKFESRLMIWIFFWIIIYNFGKLTKWYFTAFKVSLIVTKVLI